MALVLWMICTFTGAVRGEDLWTAQSRFYKVHTALDRQRTKAFARHMDKVFAEYRKRFSDFRSRHTGQMSLYLFKTAADYQAYLATHGINATNSGGMFFITPEIEGLATWVHGHNRTRTFRTLQHEGFHQFAWNYLGDEPPPWVNEGLAQYFGDGIVTRSGMKLGLVNQRRLALVRRAIAKGRAIKIDRVLGIDHEQWHQTLNAQPGRAALLYAQSWSMVYLLIHGDHGRYRDAFEQYLKLVSSGRHSEQAFTQAFGTDDLAAMDTRWRAYVNHLQPDPLTTAIEHMEFLAMGLEKLRQRGFDMPHTLGQLKRLLQRGHFTVTRSSHGLTRREQASDDSLYTYEPSRGRAVPFKLLEPSAENLPPRIYAPGLHPEPTLTWMRSEDDAVTSLIRYR